VFGKKENQKRDQEKGGETNEAIGEKEGRSSKGRLDRWSSVYSI